MQSGDTPNITMSGEEMTKRTGNPDAGGQSTYRPSSTRGEKHARRDRRYVSEYEEVEQLEVKDARPGFHTHKMDEEQSSGHSLSSDRRDPRVIFAKLLMARSITKLAKEYVDARAYLPKDYSVDIYKQNESRNRYTDVLCNDKTRVILNNGNYLHANWLPIPNSMQRFICAQGPLDETAEDFWAMVLQERAQVIVMLCDFTENGVEKCFEYFPKSMGVCMRIGPFAITNVTQSECDIDTVKWSVLEVVGPRRRVLLHHFLWNDWPDHLSPLTPTIALDLLHFTKAKSDLRPIVVHCSAGIGRTGTFVGIDFANERLKGPDKLSLLDIMKELRTHRLQSIQSHLQYLYLAVCLLECFARQNIIERDEKYQAFLNNYVAYVKRHAAKHGVKRKKD